MKVDGRIERLIVRKLDNELTGSEQLELDRALLRSADVRALFESYAEIDDLAADVIRSCTRGSTGNTREIGSTRGIGSGRPVLTAGHEVVAVRPRHHAWMIYAGALAACLALVLIWKTPDSSYQDFPTNVASNRSSTAPSGMNRSGNGWPAGNGRLVPAMANPNGTGLSHAALSNAALGNQIGVWSASELPAQRFDRFTNQNLIVIPSENGGYYLFSVDHVRQIRQPKEQVDTLLWKKPI